jgi:hypothetical protein
MRTHDAGSGSESAFASVELHPHLQKFKALMHSSESGLVSRASPVQTALRNYTGDEGRSFEFDNQVLISSHRKLLWSKAMVVSVAECREMIPSGMVERGERKRTTGEVSKSD